MKVYLCGAMSGLTFEQMNEWRVNAKHLFQRYAENIHTENPCNYYNFEMNPNTYTQKEIKDFDLWLVRNCNLILVNLDYPDSIGTAIELETAQNNNIPVIGFGTTLNHPWIELNITCKKNTLEEAIEYIMSFYYPNI